MVERKEAEAAKSCSTYFVGMVMCIRETITKWSTPVTWDLKGFGGHLCHN